MDLDVRDRSVLVLAGTRGIGLSTAALHREGGSVNIRGRSPDALGQALTTIDGAFGLTADVTSRDRSRAGRRWRTRSLRPGRDFGDQWRTARRRLRNARRRSLAQSGRLDLDIGDPRDASALPGMRAARQGRIVIISLLGVKQPVPGLTLSNSVRMAVLGWAKTLSRQIAGDNILINTVCPGWTRTERVDFARRRQHRSCRDGALDPRHNSLGRMDEADGIARLAVFLGSAAANHMTGTTIQVDGGLMER